MLSIGLSISKCYVACAGAGKTTLLVNQAIERISACGQKKVCILTFTRKNQDNVRMKLWSRQQQDIEVCGWLEFLLKYFARPYKGLVISELCCKPLGLDFVTEQSGLVRDTNHNKFYKTYTAGDLTKKYLTKKGDKIHSDKLAEFCIECYKKDKDVISKRLANAFDSIFIDEAQDLAGHDYDIIKILIKSGVHLVLAGDPRQHTYDSHPTSKYSAYRGRFDKYCTDHINSRKKTVIEIDDKTLNSSWRCPQQICDVANIITSNHKPMLPHNKELSALLYVVKESEVNRFVERYHPIALTWNINIAIDEKIHERYNWGESKGLEFDNVIVYPTDSVKKWLAGKKVKWGQGVAEKLYVAFTRAKSTLAIVMPDDFKYCQQNFSLFEG